MKPLKSTLQRPRQESTRGLRPGGCDDSRQSDFYREKATETFTDDAFLERPGWNLGSTMMCICVSMPLRDFMLTFKKHRGEQCTKAPDIAG